MGVEVVHIDTDALISVDTPQVLEESHKVWSLDRCRLYLDMLDTFGGRHRCDSVEWLSIDILLVDSDTLILARVCLRLYGLLGEAYLIDIDDLLPLQTHLIQLFQDCLL